MCGEATDGSVQVVVRLRPPYGARQHDGGDPRIDIQGRDTITVELPHEDVMSTFRYDAAFDSDASQSALFNALGPGIVNSCMNGYNSSTFAYGQTGSGKTHTMLGDMSATSQDRGFVPRLLQLLFRRIAESEAAQGQDAVQFSVRCSFLEIYNEAITDLLNPVQCADDSMPGGSSGNSSSGGLKIRQSDKRGTFVEGLTEEFVLNVEEVLSLLRRGTEQRHMGVTLMNRESSRSHGVLTCTVERHTKTSDGLTHVLSSRLNLIDLAGSEQLGKSKSQGERMKEARHINQSLTALGRVIMELVEQQRSGRPGHVPYRDSKLTFLLQDSLGGNAKTTIIANISPSAANINETLSTLRFAQDARSLRNRPQQNRKTMGRLSALQAEIERLKQEVAGAHARNDELSAAVEAQRHLQESQQVLRALVEALQEHLETCLSTAAQDAALRANCLKEVEQLNAELARGKAALATSQQAEQLKEQELQLQLIAAEELRVQLATASRDIQAAAEQLQQQQAHAAELEQQLSVARATAREAAGQQQVLTQQLLAAREASRTDTQGKQTLAIQLRSTEARLAHQTHELDSVKKQLSSVEECAEAAAKLARQQAEALQTLQKSQHQQEQHPDAANVACAAEGDLQADVLSLRVRVSELQALLAEEKRAQAAVAARAAAKEAELQFALDAARTARDGSLQQLEEEQAQRKAATSQLQEAQKHAAAAGEQLLQKTQKHMLTAATAVVGNLEQLEKAARARAEAAEARAHAAETAANLAIAARSKLEAALAAAREASDGTKEAEARAAAYAAAAGAAEARARAAEAAAGLADERAAAAEAAAQELQEQLRAAAARALAAARHDAAVHEAAVAAGRASEVSGTSEEFMPLASSVASSLAAGLQRRVARTHTAPVEFWSHRVDQQRDLLHQLDQEVSDDSGDSTPRRHFTPQHTVEAICSAFKLMGDKPFLPLSITLTQAANNLNKTPERMASSDSGDSTPRLPGNDALHELSPEVTSKLRRALGNISNHQDPPAAAAGREAARSPFMSFAAPPKIAGVQELKRTADPPSLPAWRGLATTAKQPAEAPANIKGRRGTLTESWHLRDMFQLTRDLARKRGQRSSDTAPPFDASMPTIASKMPAPQQ